MEDLKLFICNHCKKVIERLPGSCSCATICCGEEMHELKPNTTEAAVEKHIPVVNQNGNEVEIVVGSTLHPMIEEHYIQFIYLQTNKNLYRHDLKPGDAPKANFIIGKDENIEKAYAYCNIHGFWAK